MQNTQDISIGDTVIGTDAHGKKFEGVVIRTTPHSVSTLERGRDYTSPICMIDEVRKPDPKEVTQ